jgi:ABC-type nitrate/sulfonate/bicarbonate transport system permease component
MDARTLREHSARLRFGHGASSVGRGLLGYLPAAAFLVFLIGFWEAWVRIFNTRPYILPAPSQVWQAFLETKHTLPEHITTTLTEALLGLAIAATAGVVIAMTLTMVPFIRRMLYPLLVISQTIPMVVLAPLLVVWFGFGMTPKVVVVALFGFFPICVATADGLLGADREMVGLVRSMGGKTMAVMRYVLIPSALPAFFAGLKIAATYAVLGAIIGEWVGASSGLGIYITRAQTAFRIDRVFVAVVVVAAVSIALFAAVHLAARLATPWMYVNKEDGS